MDYQVCTKTVMDTSDPGIVFDESGVCQYWYSYQIMQTEVRRKIETQPLESLVAQIKAAGSGMPYDCLIGVSGGIDSSFVAYQCHRLGLRPLAVHFDGGWDSELSSHNLEVTTSALGFERFDLRVPAEEINELLIAYLRSSVIDIGVYADHAILATMYNLAHKHNIKYVLSGANLQTESINPKAWVANKLDTVNLRYIHRKFGEGSKLRGYPTCGFLKHAYYQGVTGMRLINLIDWFDFREDAVKSLLAREIDWQPYERKHGEVVFTKFYQNYILPTKFGVDKRRMHLSSLICSGQLTREKALENLQEPLYSHDELHEDRVMVLTKLGLSEDEFKSIMALPPRSNQDFPTDERLRKVWMATMKATSALRSRMKKRA